MKLAVLLMCIFLLSSCFQYEEELNIKKDGSGTVVMRMKLSKMISFFESLDDDQDDEIDFKDDFKFNNVDGIEILKEQSYKKKGKKIYEVELKFDDYKKLSKIRFNNKHINLKNNKKKRNNSDLMDNLFQDLSIENGKYIRLIELNNEVDGDEDIPRFVKDMLDIEFSFKATIEGIGNKTWIYDMDDLVKADVFEMKLK
jgi:hypothetical protein